MLFTLLRCCTQYGLLAAARKASVLVLWAALATTAAAAEPVKVMAFGDSLTAGFGLPQDQGLVPQLQRWLEAAGAQPVEVINMGVSGDTSAGGRARLAWALDGGGDAVILELGANDMLRGIDPAETRANLDAILTEITARGLPVLVVGMKSSANFGAGYKARFDAIFPDLADKHGAQLDPFFFEGLLDRPGMFQPDGLHPSADGVAVVVERIGPLVLDLISRARP